MTDVSVKIESIKGGMAHHQENGGDRIDIITDDGSVILKFMKSHDFKFFKRFFQDSQQAIEKFARGVMDVFEKYYNDAKRRVETLETGKDFYKGKMDAFETIIHYLKTQMEEE